MVSIGLTSWSANGRFTKSSRHARSLSKRVRHGLGALSDTFGWFTKFITMLVLLESVLAVVIIGLAAFTSLNFGGPVAALVFLACWIVAVTPFYFWNKARQARTNNAFDDRLTDERMAKGREMIISQFEKQREDEKLSRDTTEQEIQQSAKSD